MDDLNYLIDALLVEPIRNSQPDPIFLCDDTPKPAHRYDEEIVYISLEDLQGCAKCKEPCDDTPRLVRWHNDCGVNMNWDEEIFYEEIKK